MIVGIDEVGRGPLAGPVVAAAVVLLTPIDGLKDSKTLSASERHRLDQLVRHASRFAIGAASTTEIDELNIRSATLLAMSRAFARLRVSPDRALVDGREAPDLPCETVPVVKGDSKEPAIAAASIVAKVARDRLMARLHVRYPCYGWGRNAGYPTQEHIRALLENGVTIHHRTTFAPVRRVLTGRT